MKAREKQSRAEMMLNAKPDFEFVRPTDLLKSKEGWREVREYAEFLTDFF